MTVKQIWTSGSTARKSRYAWTTLGSILGIAALMMVLLFGGMALGMALHWPMQWVSLLLCAGVTALGVRLGLGAGRRSLRDATVFLLTGDNRLFFLNAADLNRGRSPLDYAKGTLDTQALIDQAGVSPYGFLYPDTYCVLMDASTGRVLAEQNSHAQVAPASVTKVMTMLLLCEAMEAGQIGEQDIVTASAYASSIGGSQIYLEEGEQMTVEDLMMSLALPSANDAAVCLGEYLCGSEEAFVERMNQRAQELGMENTHFATAWMKKAIIPPPTMWP